MSPLIRWVTRACCRRDTTGQGAAASRLAIRARTVSTKPVSSCDSVILRRAAMSARTTISRANSASSTDKRGARLCANKFERLRNESMSRFRRGVGRGNDREYRHQQKETHAFECRGYDGERCRPDSAQAGKCRKILHKGDRLPHQGGHRRTRIHHLRPVHWHRSLWLGTQRSCRAMRLPRCRVLQAVIAVKTPLPSVA